MTSNKAQKTAIRERMKKTGERYTAARRTLLDTDRRPDERDAESDAPVAAPPVETRGDLPTGASPNGVMPDLSSEAIRRGTGRDWTEWLAVLDAWGAANRSHKEIAIYLHDVHGVEDWWCQGVTVGYERLRGRRVVGQVGDGVFSGSASKTLPAGAHDAFTYLTEEHLRDRWLDPGMLRMRTSVADKSARFDLVEPAGIVTFFLTVKGPAKSLIAVQHDRLPSKAAADAFRAEWKEHFGHLAGVLRERD